ncbi:MAG: succinate dehydrogenase assembly factor 2 [Deferribacteraceae bacterium]|jgi:succinate dehydrogenase flavin-adding protein (antitoxin of CptAB toxin-antitoxin module)|nr:succinate dehydrogenase assembly factor 2 [Deferribacteraceae bacterium]
MKTEHIYKKAYYHAVRRAMKENEAFMQVFMDNTAVNYDESMLEQLDAFLVKIPDNDLLDLILGHKTPENFKVEYNERILTDIVNLYGNQSIYDSLNL